MCHSVLSGRVDRVDVHCHTISGRVRCTHTPLVLSLLFAVFVLDNLISYITLCLFVSHPLMSKAVLGQIFAVKLADLPVYLAHQTN